MHMTRGQWLTGCLVIVAAAIAAVYEFGGKPKSFELIGEGSLLWDGWRYSENVQKQLALLGVPKGTITIEHIQDSSINGALGLLIK